jgi:hypothetical protein
VFGQCADLQFLRTDLNREIVSKRTWKSNRAAVARDWGTPGGSVRFSVGCGLSLEGLASTERSFRIKSERSFIREHR